MTMPARRASKFSAKRCAVSPEMFFQSLISQAIQGFCEPWSECQPEWHERASVKFGTVLVQYWYGISMKIVRSMYGFLCKIGTNVVPSLYSCRFFANFVPIWYHIGTNLGPSGYQLCTKLVLSWNQLGTSLVPTWYQFVSIWYQIGTYFIANWYQLGTHLVSTWHQPRMFPNQACPSVLNVSGGVRPSEVPPTSSSWFPQPQVLVLKFPS